ncbi:hypothetical protein LOZ80_38060 [Paenibacillus sp. HWE-109]|uniref:hypothetical protein n=1 Tax=Paenibacillus sp. HWE-109 TaxID=1306526 RepID=UPI001EDE1522|nr:hypothetical protein [Paenibacillus sp. HWE-109]UKS27198.1 hypothetical protein LOZ80_38060 [Paenibacillus sp. HWE-109]
MSMIRIAYHNQFENIRNLEPVVDTFTIKPKPHQERKFKRIMKRLRQLAEVTKYDRWKEERVVKQVQIDLTKIERMLFDHITSIEILYHRRCRMIVVGYKQMQMLDHELRNYMSFTFPLDYRSSTVFHGEKIEYRGIEVVCIPWIDGIFAIPKE